jgi:hypothetical protein
MAELVEFAELQQVLQDLANDIRDNYKEHLEFNDRYTREHKLIDSVKTQVVVGDRAFEITMTLQDYWKYVEEGVQGARNMTSPYRNPGWKAFPHIMRWIDIKPVIPRPMANGKIPTPKQLGYLITRSIVNNGTQGSHDLQKVKDGVIPWYREKIEAALGHDMEWYIRKLIAEE